MRYLVLAEVVELHRRLLQATGGATGLRDLSALESAIAQPQATFSGVDLYPTLAEKATALCLALIQGHPFVDGNKRVGHSRCGPPGTQPTDGLVAPAPQGHRVIRDSWAQEPGPVPPSDLSEYWGGSGVRERLPRALSRAASEGRS
jgi:hypothetical protein